MTDAPRWRPPPPPEAYSRVSDPERFRPLHATALALLDRLTAEYDVRRTAEFELTAGMRPFPHARPPVRLAPALAGAAPIAIAFSPQPSLAVRYGRWRSEPFPSCACDACAETAEEEGERLRRTIEHVVAGRFREWITLPFIGKATMGYSLGDEGGAQRSGGWSRIPRVQARTLLAGGPREIRWLPWPRRA